MDLRIVKANESYLKIHAETSLLYELSDYFTFQAPGAKYDPRFKAKIWDGNIRLFSLSTRKLYAGLYDQVLKFAKDRDYTVDDSEYQNATTDIDYALVEKFVQDLNMHSDGEPLEHRPYQIQAVHHAISTGRCLMLSPTASGKSSILYSLVRYNRIMKRRQLIIVPTTALVEQMYSDFEDYSSENGWNVEKNCHRLYSGYEKTNDFPVLISTWQTLQNLPEDFFLAFDAVIGDEVHTFKAKELTNIMNQCVNAKYRVGVTGTLDGMKTNERVVQGLFGPVHKVVTTKELMDAGTLASLKIICLNFEYPLEVRKSIKKPKQKSLLYQEEVDFLVQYEPRNKFIAKLSKQCKGNTLILFRYVDKQGKPLYNMIKDMCGETRKVYLVYGGVDTVVREEIRKIVETESDAIIVASYQTFSTGTNIRNLNNVIFASPSKSRVQVLQSIGRGLRKSKSKTECTLYDLSDNISTNKSPNHTLKHFAERIKYYNEEQLNYNIVKVNLS